MGKESDLYDPLNTKTLGGELRLEVDTYENVQDNIHLEGVNRKLLELTDLVGRVTNNRSSSGPIPNTCSIKQVSETSDGVVSIFTPPSGTVFVLIGGTVSGSGGGNRSYILIDDGTVSDFEIADETVTSGQQNPWSPISGTGPFYLDSGTTLKANITNVSGTAVVKAYVCRVR